MFFSLSIHSRAVFPAKKRVLVAIQRDKEIHGYLLAKRLGQDTATVYEHLRDLEREGYVTSREVDRKRLYTLTDKGKTLMEIL